MAVSLQIDRELTGTAQTVRDQRGHGSQLSLSTTAVGIGTTAIGKRFEVVGDVVTRESAGSGRTAASFLAEPAGLASLWTNNSYDPARPTAGWMRTINMRNGNVGIGLNRQAPTERLEVDGNILVTGDIRLLGGDAAEEFDVRTDRPLEPGDVMVLDDDGLLSLSQRPYDRRVAGVVAGAAGRHPAIVLGRDPARPDRVAIALLGRVYCKAEARDRPIAVGDLLTTSPLTGHAMRVTDPARAFGAVLGKAMGRLEVGSGLLPVLVALQ